jgi:hypothetical protein
MVLLATVFMALLATVFMALLATVFFMAMTFAIVGLGYECLGMKVPGTESGWSRQQKQQHKL